MSRILKPASTVNTQSSASLCRVPGILCDGQAFTADEFNAYVEIHLVFGYPVTTIWKTGIHPQVIQNSFRSLNRKVFDLAHLVRSYNPDEIPRDCVLGTIMAVEFPKAVDWKVQADPEKSPYIRAVAVMHKQLERVREILATWQSGKVEWKVSMEQNFPVEEGVAITSGFAVHGRKGVEAWADSTPEDLKALDVVYVPCADAPAALNKCFDVDKAEVVADYQGQRVDLLFGGLNGEIFFKGAGLTPEGAEPPAKVAQMLASAQRDCTWPMGQVLEILKK